MKHNQKQPVTSITGEQDLLPPHLPDEEMTTHASLTTHDEQQEGRKSYQRPDTMQKSQDLRTSDDMGA